MLLMLVISLLKPHHHLPANPTLIQPKIRQHGLRLRGRLGNLFLDHRFCRNLRKSRCGRSMPLNSCCRERHTANMTLLFSPSSCSRMALLSPARLKKVRFCSSAITQRSTFCTLPLSLGFRTHVGRTAY